MTSPELERLVEIGKLKREPPSRNDLLAAAEELLDEVRKLTPPGKPGG